MRFHKEILKIALAALFFILTILFALLAIAFQPYRILVWLLSKFFLPRNVSFAHGLSSFFLLGSPAKPWLNILVYLVVDGDVSLEYILSAFREKIQHKNGYENLQSYFAQFMGYTFIMKSKHFKIENHIRKFDYQVLGSPFQEEDLQRMTGSLVGEKWRKGQSPWEILIAKNFRYTKNDALKTVLIFRFDHGLMDGYSLFKMVYTLLDWEENFGSVTNNTTPKKKGGNFWKKLFFPLKIFYDFADQHVDAFTWPCTFPVEGNSESVGFQATLMKSIPIERIKRIKNKFNVNYNAVLLTGLGGGIYRILKESGQKIPKYMTAFVPLARANHPGGLTNYMNCSRLALRIHPANPEIMKEVSNEIMKTQVSLSGLALLYLIYLGSLMPNFVSRLIQSYDFDQAIVGNMPILNVRYNGYPVIDSISVMANTSGFLPPGLTVTMGGIDGKQRMGATIDKKLFPSQDIFKKLGEYVREEILGMLHE